MRYKILGVTEVRGENGERLPLGGARLRALLAALASRAGRTVGAELLIDEVWADDPPGDASAALQALVGRLRRVVGRNNIALDAGGYRLAAAPEDVDLFVFERLLREGTSALAAGAPEPAARLLGEALALWRGPALADLPDAGAGTRPEAQRLEAIRARAEAELRLGRAAALVPDLRELTAAHPYDETLRALLIRALRDAGRRADALAAYESARRTLGDGLGTEPGPELRELYVQLLDPEHEAGTSDDGSGNGPTSKSVAYDGTSATTGTADRGPAAHVTPAPAPSEHFTSAASPVPAVTGPDAATEPHAPAPAPSLRHGNIRPRLTSFVGREPELDAIRADLARSRLVTLTGPGGSGKTRLAEEAAANPRAGSVRDGSPAWIAELAPLDAPEAVPGAVVTALGLRETMLRRSNELGAAQEDPVGILVEYCAGRDLLLVLDNCEHVVDAAARLAETLLTHCPGLTVLATSREPLGVPGECVRPVEPLPPDPAVRLFTERARAVHPGFDPGRDAGPVAEICRRLDGLPLAIELAAARLRLLTPRQIADRLDDRFRLLTSGSRTVLPRQQTLRAVVDWSWELLDDRERGMLCEVTVFAGGWDLAAAEAVCSGPAADLIGALVDKSLVVAAPAETGDGMRYRLLETIHEYAREHAAAVPEIAEAAARRHAAHFRQLVESADPLLRTADQLPWMQRLETEHDNIRAALHRAVDRRDEDLALRLTGCMSWFWWLRNYRRESVDWICAALRLGAEVRGRPAEEGDVLGTVLAEYQGPDADAHWDAEGFADADSAYAKPSWTMTAAAATAPEGPGGGTASTASTASGPAARPAAVPPTAPDVSPAAPAVSPAAPAVPPTAADAGPRTTDQVEGEDDPLFWPRMRLCLFQLILMAEAGPSHAFLDPRIQRHLRRIHEVFDRPVPQAVRFPGAVWPFAVFLLAGPDGMFGAMDRSLANCRRFGSSWDVAVTLMFRTHMVVDLPGGMRGVDEDLAELRVLSAQVGDRWMRAHVCGAAGEAATARGRFAEARGEYGEALRHAYEVGAYAEMPFLRGRLAETAFRAGEREAALALIAEATEEAERHGVADARAFLALLRSWIALDDKDLALARELLDAARYEALRGTPPPQFRAALDALGARLLAAESGAAEGLPVVATGLHRALVARCADPVVATLIDSGAALLDEMGDPARAARLLGAGAERRGCPRPQPELGEAQRVRAHAEAALGADAVARELAIGAALSADAVVAELCAASGIEPLPPAGDMDPSWPPTLR